MTASNKGLLLFIVVMSQSVPSCRSGEQGKNTYSRPVDGYLGYFDFGTTSGSIEIHTKHGRIAATIDDGTLVTLSLLRAFRTPFLIGSELSVVLGRCEHPCREDPHADRVIVHDRSIRESPRDSVQGRLISVSIKALDGLLSNTCNEFIVSAPWLKREKSSEGSLCELVGLLRQRKVDLLREVMIVKLEATEVEWSAMIADTDHRTPNGPRLRLRVRTDASGNISGTSVVDRQDFYVLPRNP